MASTNPFPHAESNTDCIESSTSTGASRRSGNRCKTVGVKDAGSVTPRRARSHTVKANAWLLLNSLKAALSLLCLPAAGILALMANQKKPVERTKVSVFTSRCVDSNARSFEGWPSLESLKPALLFLCFPAVVILAMMIAGGLPKPVLYLAGFVIGLIVAMSTFKTVELTVLCVLLYLPFAKSYVIPVAPGLNGTNMLIMLGLATAFMYASRERVKFVVWPPGSILVIAFGVYTALSAFTILQHPGGASLLKSEILSYKSWLDQFVIYLILVALIRDKAGAKRAAVYMMIGSMAVVIYTIPEMLEKMGRSSIEKSRILGPQLQSNNFGGFVAYTLLPMLAFFMVYIKDIRAWMLTPYFLLAIKVLITTFSRGAYVAIAAGGLLVGYYRGKAFLSGFAVLSICIVIAFPSVIPESISARMGGLIGGETAASSAPEEEKLDKSSSTRFVMWEAAGQMMMESPILGKGFKSFPFLKEQYIQEEVEEDDPHSMYFYLGSQMGIPALVLFLLIMGYMFKLGRFHSQNRQDKFIRAIGIGGTGIPLCYAVVCIFGSRAVALNFTIYFWAYLVILQVLKKDSDEGDVAGVGLSKAGARSKRSRRMTARVQSDQVLIEDSEGSVVASSQPPRTARKTRAGQRIPKRGAAAYIAQKADRRDLELQAQREIEALRAAKSDKPSVSAAFQDQTNPAYETRAAKRARQARNYSAAGERPKRQGS